VCVFTEKLILNQSKLIEIILILLLLLYRNFQSFFLPIYSFKFKYWCVFVVAIKLRLSSHYLLNYLTFQCSLGLEFYSSLIFYYLNDLKSYL